MALKRRTPKLWMSLAVGGGLLAGCSPLAVESRRSLQERDLVSLVNEPTSQLNAESHSGGTATANRNAPAKQFFRVTTVGNPNTTAAVTTLQSSSGVVQAQAQALVPPNTSSFNSNNNSSSSSGGTNSNFNRPATSIPPAIPPASGVLNPRIGQQPASAPVDAAQTPSLQRLPPAAEEVQPNENLPSPPVPGSNVGNSGMNGNAVPAFQSSLRMTNGANGGTNCNVPMNGPPPACSMPCAVPTPPLPAGCRANLDPDAQCWLRNYQSRLAESGKRPTCVGGVEDAAPLPHDFRPWWDAMVQRQSAVCRTPRSICIDTLIDHALRFSSYVQIVAYEPGVHRANIVIEEADFDWRSFLNSTYNKLNDPVGNILTTGNGDTRFRDQTWSLDAGAKKRNPLGGELRMSQKFGTQQNNSRFLLPNPQGTSRLELQYTQPLLNGAGRCVNESRIVLAQLDTSMTEDEAILKLQDHLVRVTEAYWELYRARAEYFQRMKLLGAAQNTLDILRSREEVDATSQQVLRANAAVISRRSEIIRVQTLIRNAESQLRLLVNSPELLHLGPHEMTPTDSPLIGSLPISMEESLHTALVSRPDISHAIRSVRSSAVRLGVAENQVLPKLDLIASTYVAGLAGHHEFFNASGKQFSEGGPGYSVGLAFEMPWGNRAAVARQEQRQLEMNRALANFRLTVEESLTSTEIAVRELETNYREMLNHYQAIVAAENEVNYLFNRWKTIPGVDDSAAFLLENLLDAQARLADEEGAMVRSQVNYAMAIVKVKRQMGTLLKVSHDQ